MAQITGSEETPGEPEEIKVEEEKIEEPVIEDIPAVENVAEET